jgi:hypothetical protein
MDAFLRNAEQILETALEGRSDPALTGALPDYLIAVSRTGALRIIEDTNGWSLPALAAECGATAVYRVARRARLVRVEGWSVGRTCVLSRESPEMLDRSARAATRSLLPPRGWAA